MTGTHEPELSGEVAARTTGLRTGWTTGTCASAAAKAAATGLVTGIAPTDVEVGLPDGRRVRFPVEAERANRCMVVKDAGDDPDCTDGARMTAELQWAEAGQPTVLVAGEGVGTITKPGLGLPVGAPAINQVPRRMILDAVGEVTERPVVATFSVPGGEAMSAKTTNARLGILGGISILGTTGVVRPFSTAAYRASVVQQINVAAAQGERTMVLATGHRSERAARILLPDLPEVCFCEVGDFTGIALRRAAAADFARVVWVGMAGKVAKLADGVMMTHFHRSKVNGELLANAARAAGAAPALVDSATETATARHFAESCVAAGDLSPLEVLATWAAEKCRAHAGPEVAVDVVVVDFEGEQVLARA